MRIIIIALLLCAISALQVYFYGAWQVFTAMRGLLTNDGADLGILILTWSSLFVGVLGIVLLIGEEKK